MATTGRLGDIAALTDQLTPLADRQRGMPIEAAQWNTLVAVLRGVLEIDRAQENGLAQSLADTYARADHQHLGQVTLAWLDPDLATRLTDAGGSVSVRTALVDVAARLDDATRRVAALADTVERGQKRTDDGAADELARSARLRALEDKLAVLDGLRALVTSLSAAVADLTPSVRAVLELRAELTTAAGGPINVRGLAGDVATTQADLREATLGVDGRPLRLRDIEIVMRETQDALGLGEGVLEARVDARVRKAVDASSAALRAAFADQLDSRAAALEQRIDTGLADLDTRMNGTLNARAEQVERELGTLSQAVDGRLSGLADEITSRIVEQTAGRIEPAVLENVQGAVRTMVNQAVGDVQTRLKELELRVRRLDQR
ncbi:hypothetical protein [Frankia gtarii]|uniref:hypothetical protein n=1 Tax=Frankia gtarii TaxID=2950102 RepID=UPI0021C0AA82|nr:hypothetical protein [Frankia gtarii]